MTNNIEEIKEKIKEVPVWWHSINLCQDVYTPGHKTRQILENELNLMKLPDLKGKTVLDIGAWDGFYSFESEKRGASRVVALDHFMWSIDIPGMRKYKEECQKNNIIPRQYEQVPEIWRPNELPGKRGFDISKKILNSQVEEIIGDFMEMDLNQVGTFDIVLYLGVLYHIQNPMDGLKRLSKVTKELAVIETEAMIQPGFEDYALCKFFETNELNNDITNWWVPNEKALVGMCLAAGFSHVDVLVKAPVMKKSSWTRRLIKRLLEQIGLRKAKDNKPLHYRAIVHAWK
jgi:tRNA (mo5U34)-methyltransferase